MDICRMAENEILETAINIDIQDNKWKIIILSIMKENEIEYYPSKSHFVKSDKYNIYQDICRFAEHIYMADIMGLETHREYKMKECIFDTMEICNINYMPDSEMYYSFAQKKMGFNHILKHSTLEEQRIRLKLYTKKEYEKMTKKSKK